MMEEVHRSLLRHNRTDLIKNIADPLEVVNLLYEKNLLTESMKQDVEAERTPIARTRKILDIVPMRGPNAFSIFYQCLLQTSNDTAAAILRPDLSDAQEGQELPQDWPNVDAMTALIVVKRCIVGSDVVTNNLRNPNVYPMKKKRRGRCLIISNKTFFGPLEKDKDGIERVFLPVRHGTSKDVNRVTELFSQLQFEVNCRKDLTADAMKQELSQESSHQDHNTAECFVCVICSHGTSTGIYGTDGNIVPVETLIEYFDGHHCIPLKGKPKLFFIQACRGETFDIAERTVRDGSQDLSNLLQQSSVSDASASRRDARDTVPVHLGDPKVVPAKADILVAYATHPGYVSLRNEYYGSWFIQAVVCVFQIYACSEDIFMLLTLVNKLVARGKSRVARQGDGVVVQAPQYTTSFTNKFMFFPGINTEV